MLFRCLLHSSLLPARQGFRGLRSRLLWFLLAACCQVSAVAAQTMKAPDITQTPTLYVVPYAHLDTQWRWNFPQTISEYLLKTMRVNFDYIDKYPHYVFNWTGANRYRLMKEYYPDDYARLKQYAAQGRWFPAGSSIEEGDVNLPSAEGLFRQVPLWQRVFPQGVSAKPAPSSCCPTVSVSRLVAHHSQPRRYQRILHPEAQFRLAAGTAGRGTRFSGANSGRNPIQRRPLDWS